MSINTEKIMYWWAKISSLVVAYFVIYAIYVAFFGIKTYLNIQETRLEAASLGSYMPNFLSFGDLMIMLLGLGFSIIFGLYFYSPFLYYGWVKNPKNKHINTIAKIVSVIWSGILIYGIFLFIGSSVIKLTDTLAFLGMIIFAIPLYYFAWRK
jgi:hypothetical protein